MISDYIPDCQPDVDYTKDDYRVTSDDEKNLIAWFIGIIFGH